MKRAALYLRVSSEEQTVENQRPELARLAKARGLKVVATYEENVSAVKVRPAFARMMEDAHARRFDVLVIWAIDRFGRSMAGNLADVMALDARGVRIVSARESWLEMDGPARALLVAVFSWVAEQERRRLSERTIAGMERARASGLHVGRPRASIPLAVVQSLASAGCSLNEIARRYEVSPRTLARRLRAELPMLAIADKRGMPRKAPQATETRGRASGRQKGPL